MKYILILLFIGLIASYNPDAAVSYAKKYCRNYNSAYPNYKGRGGDCANFVSQCLKKGGFDFKGCANLNEAGLNIGVTSLRNCLLKKGWKEHSKKPSNFRSGYPMAKLDYSHAIIASSVSGNTIKFCAHTTDYCDKTLGYSVYYYTPK